jgi:type I restriction enzyme R subunit
MAGFTEASTVQAWMVARLVALGWTHIPGVELPRENTDVLVEAWTADALVALNPAVTSAPDRVDEVLPQLRATLMGGASESLVPANEQMTQWLRGIHTARFAGTTVDVPIRLLDFGGPDDLRQGRSPSGNTYVVSDEVTFGTPGKERRFDIVLLVNGIPLVVIETKTPVKESVSWLKGAKDLTGTYAVEYPQYFVPNVLMVASEGLEYHYGAVGQAARDWELWGSTNDPYDLSGLPRVERSIETQLQPARLLALVRDFTLFETDPGGRRRKLLPRYPQVEAAEAILDKVISGGPGGLIWHYQGTGKTLLQAFAAGMLLRDPRAGSPTIVCVVDRLELFEQTAAQFHSAGVPRFEVAESKAHLRDLLRQDFRGVIMTTIHRFDREDRNLPPAVLNDRANIIVTVDEAHRTTEGSLGDDMRAALPNARFFGMTGTPIADNERNTFRLFGDPADPGYIMSKYEPERSMADGATVPVRIETRLVDFHLESSALEAAFEAFLDEETDGTGKPLSDKQSEYLTRKAASIKTVVSNPARVTAVCADIVDHFIARVDPLGMKAMVVAFDREMVVTYAETIRRLLAEKGLGYGVEVVMNVTSGKDEPPEFKPYLLTQSAEADVKRRFRDFDDSLKFVVVTAKLLTGFDAPILFAQYLDRPLRRVNLFQAITRPNRNWTNPATGQRKRFGLVVDYVGLGEEIGAALSPDDPHTPRKEMSDIADLIDEFAIRIADAMDRFGGIDIAKPDYETLMDALERIPGGDKREAFAKDFTGLEAIWEFLDPHPDLDAYRARYRWLAQVYATVSKGKAGNELLWERLGAKTLDLVHHHMGDVEVRHGVVDDITIGPDDIQTLRDLALFDKDLLPPNNEPIVVTLDDVFTLIERRIKARFDATGAGVYQTLAERLERLRAQALQRAEDSVEWIKRALDLAKTMVEVERLETEDKLEEAERIVDPNIGALTQIVETYAPEGVPVIIDDLVRDVDEIVTQSRFSGWTRSSDGDRQVRLAIRRVLRAYKLPHTGELFDKTYAYVAENY